MWFLGGWMYFPLKLKSHNKAILEWAKALDIPVPERDVQKANEHPGNGVQPSAFGELQIKVAVSLTSAVIVSSKI